MLSIIPARGGSKGLPGKNIKLLQGKPLIAHTIEQALQAKEISKVIVSTDDREIADIARQYGAEVPFIRPQYLATDTALSIDNYIYTIERLKKETGVNINNFIVLQPTSPLRTSKDIDNAINLFYEKKADSVISYTEEQHPIAWHKKVNSDLSFTNIFEDKLQNRQDIKTTYYPNGAIFIFKFELILQKIYYSDKTYAYIMPRNSSVDIDTIDDFEYVEFLIQKKQK